MWFFAWTLVMVAYCLLAWRFHLWDEMHRWAFDAEPGAWIYVIPVLVSSAFALFIGLQVALA
jgi:hypothetical protein